MAPYRVWVEVVVLLQVLVLESEAVALVPPDFANLAMVVPALGQQPLQELEAVEQPHLGSAAAALRLRLVSAEVARLRELERLSLVRLLQVHSTLTLLRQVS